jgi:hypothetical protein
MLDRRQAFAWSAHADPGVKRAKGDGVSIVQLNRLVIFERLAIHECAIGASHVNQGKGGAIALDQSMVPGHAEIGRTAPIGDEIELRVPLLGDVRTANIGDVMIDGVAGAILKQEGQYRLCWRGLRRRIDWRCLRVGLPWL